LVTARAGKTNFGGSHMHYVDETSGIVAVLIVLGFVYAAWCAGRRSRG